MVEVPPLQMVDNLILAGLCGNQVVKSNAAANLFVKLKKLQLPDGKCARLHIDNFKCEGCPELLENGNPIKESQSEKYLGDYLSTSATATSTLQDRKRKGYDILGEIRAILENVPLGNKRLEIGLTLRESWFLNGTLYNSEVWISYNKNYLNELQVLDRKILCLISNAHSKSQNEMLYFEYGALSISHIVSIRRLSYLQILLGRLMTP